MSKTAAIACALVLLSFQVAPPDTEIYLARLQAAGGQLAVSAPENITGTPGYDNQPSFTPDGRGVLFTSARDGAAAEGRAAQTDIYRYDIASRTTLRITRTPESEYSPTVTPDGRHLSVVRVESDGTQRLWRFTLDGADPALVLADVKPVGYHAWASASTLALFVLGQPATLQIADTGTGRAEVVAKGIGRSIQKIPGGGISFVQREAPAGAAADAPPVLTIMEIDPATKQPAVLVRAPAGATEADVAWTADGTLLTIAGDVLHTWRRGQPEWKRATDLGALGIRGASRLAVGPKGDLIALVAAGTMR